MAPLFAGMELISFIGPQGSGKTTIGKIFAEHLNCAHAEASEVVRDIYGDLSRSEMPKTNARTASEPDWLGKAIHKDISNTQEWWEIQEFTWRNYHQAVVTGVREQEVHDYFWRKGHTVKEICLWAPTWERYKRLRAIGKCEDSEEFLRHEESERSIGLQVMLDRHAHHEHFIHTHSSKDPSSYVYPILDMLYGPRSQDGDLTRVHNPNSIS